ncbi:unnamed protein product, partial [Callosobruchus maculatus]
MSKESAISFLPNYRKANEHLLKCFSTYRGVKDYWTNLHRRKLVDDFSSGTYHNMSQSI